MTHATRLLLFQDLRSKGITFSKAHLWRLERNGSFPKRVPLSAGRHAWVENEIDDWVTSRIAVRDGSRKQAIAA
jgi:prophage regulatory protein